MASDSWKGQIPFSLKQNINLGSTVSRAWMRPGPPVTYKMEEKFLFEVILRVNSANWPHSSKEAWYV